MRRGKASLGKARRGALALAGAALALLAARPAGADPSGPFSWGAVHVADAGWGRMIRLAPDHWLSVGTLYPSPATHLLQIKESRDNARTWTVLSQVTEPGRRMDNGELIQLPSGAVLLTGRSVVDNQSFHLPVYRSTDGGAHWTYLSGIDANDSVASGNHPSQGLWEPHFFLLPGDRLAVAYASEKHSVQVPAYSQVCAEKVSGDGGTTWGPETLLAAQPGGGGLRPGMPVVARMADGRYIEVSEIVGVGKADVYSKVSPDGVHWPDGLGDPIPSQHAGPWVTSLSDGRLVVSSCANEISTSDDYGKTWHLTSPPAWDIGFTLSFPAIYQTGPREIAVMNTHRGVNIRFGSFAPRR